jgi:uncharacterized membrane protein (DUF485 family)
MTQVVHTSIAERSPAPPGAGFGGIARHPNPATPPPGAPDFVTIRRSPEFVALRRRFRRFVFPMSALFFVWYLTYVLLAAYAKDFMSHRLAGSITVGLALGLAQFASTLLITAGYVRFARRRIDPAVASIRRSVGLPTDDEPGAERGRERGGEAGA